MIYYVSSGMYSNGIALSNDSMYVYSGGVANEITASDYGYLYVSNGGMANSVTVKYGYLYLYDGGVASNVVLENNGSLCVNPGGTASGVIIDNGGYLSAGYNANIEELTVYSGGGFSLNVSANVSGAALYGISLYYRGGDAQHHWKDVLATEGTQVYMSAGTMINLTLTSGAILNIVSSGTVVSGLTMYEGTTAAGFTLDGGSSAHIEMIENGGVSGRVDGGVFSGAMRLGSSANLHDVAGDFTIDFADGGNYTITHSDLSQVGFSIASNMTIDLSGNYWGVTDIDAIYSKYGFSRDMVTIDGVLQSDPTTTFNVTVANLKHNTFGSATERLIFRFSHEVDASTFSDSSLQFVSSGEVPVTVNGWSLDGHDLTIDFDTPAKDGKYLVRFADSIRDLSGAELNAVHSDTNNSSGWAETLILRADYTSPHVVSVSPAGDFAGTLSEFRVNFSEALDANEVAKYVTLTDPSGYNVKIRSVRMANSMAVVEISPQTAYGEYTVTVSPELADYVGNKLDQNGDGIGGDAADGFVASFSIAEVDLKVSDVLLSSATVVPGETITVSWIDYNNGGYALSGSWTDGVYLSADTRWDVNDMLLGSVSHTGGLPQNGMLENTLNVAISGVSEGNYYILVRSDIYMQEKGDRESALAAQNLEAVPISIELPELEIDGKVSGHIAKSGDYAVWKLTQEANESLRLVLDSQIPSANMEIYVGYGYVPTREKYDSKAQKITDGTLLLDAPDARSQVYVLVYNKSTSAAFDFDLAVESVPMSITKVGGTTQGNSRGSTIDIYGTDFKPSASIYLTDHLTGAKIAAQTCFIDNTHIQAIYEAGALAAGDYTLSVAAGTETVTYSDAVSIVADAQAEFSANYSIASSVGWKSITPMTVTWQNSGTDSMYAPLVIVHPTLSDGREGAFLTLDKSILTNGFWTSTKPDGFEYSVSFLADGAAPGVLEAESKQYSQIVYYASWQTPWPSVRITINWNVSYITADSTETLDWDEILASTGYSANTRALIADNLSLSVGDTWGSYVKSLNDNLRYLDGIGTATDSLSAEDLFQFEVLQNTGALSPYRTLQSASELYAAVPGVLDFGVDRSYNSDLLSREHSGSFGYGWTTSLDSVLEISSDGDLRFVQGAGSRLYQPNYSNGYQCVAGDGSVMKKLGDWYRLTERNGISHTFDASGKLLFTADCNGNTISYSYDEAGNLTNLIHSCGETLAITRDAAGRITRIASGSGRSIDYAYDANGNLVSATDGRSGNAVTYDYSSDLAHTLTGVTDASGTEYVYTYGENGLLTGISSRDGAYSASINYGTDGDVTVTDSLNHRVTYYYDNASRLCRTVDAVSGVTTYYRYDADGNLKSISDSRGNTASFAYDALGQLTASTDVNGNTVKMTYTANGYTAGVTDSRGNVTEYTYDSKNNLTGIYYADGTCETFSYDSAGNVSTATDVRGVVTTYSHDSRGNVTCVSSNDRTVNYSYDAFGNLVGVTYADGSTGAYTFNGLDLLTGFTDANGNVTTYAYDDAGRATSVTYADGTKESFAYNAAGDLVKWTNRRGGAVNYTVDALGNTVKLARADGAAYDFAYDASGRMTTAGDLTFVYNDFDCVTGVTAADGRGIVYAYDAFDRVVSVSDGVNTTNYAYTVYGDFDTLTDGSGKLIADYDYDRYGRLEKVANGNGTFTTYTYNDYGEVTAVEHFGKDGSLTAYERYTYDTDGLVAAKTTAEGVWSYTYDKVGQLTAAVLKKDGATLRSEAYTYDNMGNRLSSTIDGVTKTYTYDNMNRIVSADGFAYRYDADGNLLEDELRTYTWTTDNRVASETLKSTGQVWEYGYDALGNRVRVTTDGVTTTYTVDANGNVFAEYVNGAFVRSYIQGGGLAAFIDAAGNAYYFDSDLLGSTVGITNGAGLTVNTYSYDSFGNVISSTEGVANDFEFVGGYGLMKNASGTTFVRARNYDAATGRWISADPIGINGGENLYVYCGNDGINYIDDIGNDRILSASITASARVGAVSPAAGIVTTAILYSFDFYTEGDDFYFKSYGNWGGPGRVNGQSYGREHIWTENDRFPRRGEPGFVEPIDPRDELYYNHDVALHDAGRIADPQERQKARRRADIDLANGLKKLKNRYGDTSFEEWLFGKENSPNNTIGKYYPTAISISGKNSTISYSVDPNDKTVTEGYGEAGYVAEKAALNYKVEFENDPEWATAPARWVRVYDTLADEFDLDTFELKSICIAGNYIEVGDARDSFNELRELDINGDKILTQISVNLDPETREIFAEFTAIDPETGWMLQDVERGILLPNDAIGSGEGFFTYSIALRDGVASGTEVTNVAEIYFDFNDPIETPTTMNTVDGTKPVLTSFTATNEGGSVVNFTFSGSDADSGIAGYNLAWSADGATYTILANVTESDWSCEIDLKTQYFFKAQAVDNVGNTSEWSDAISVSQDGFTLPAGYAAGVFAGVAWDGGGTDYVFAISRDDFGSCVSIAVSSLNYDLFLYDPADFMKNGGVIDIAGLPAGSWQWRALDPESGDIAASGALAAAASGATAFVSEANGKSDVMFARASGVWAAGYFAQHLGDRINGWSGTEEKVDLRGKNRIEDIFVGSDDANVLILSDDVEGDALFLDDIYTNDVTQSRLSGIDRIFAGAGDDVIDFTSSRYPYVGSGVEAHGGDGDDTIWTAIGNNYLFGDSGNDRLVGASGNDVLAGGIGNDRMHGGGGNDVFTFGNGWGVDTIAQLADGSVTLWFAAGGESKWDAATLTYADGQNSVTVSGVTADKVTLKFGDDGTEEYATLAAAGAFADASSEKIFEEKGKGILASL